MARKMTFGGPVTGGAELTRAQRECLLKCIPIHEWIDRRLPSRIRVDNRDWSSWRDPSRREAAGGVRHVNLGIRVRFLVEAARAWEGR